jgi:acetylornithine/succinyldiaminopimelate/putrescine aminotransferase
VIGVRYDATEIAVGITEVLCYGTAVFVEPVQGGQGFVPPPVQGPPAWVTESQK